MYSELADALRESDAYDWRSHARANQLAPPGDWRIWLLLSGRGFGKSRALSEFVRERVENGTGRRIGVVGATSGDVRDILVEGPAGILAVSPKWNRPDYSPGKRRLTWPNGAVATLFSADEPERFRGQQYDLAIADELAAWRYPESLDMLLLGLRLGTDPRLAIATTPRPTKVIRDLLSREGRDVVVTRGSTLENRANLAPAFIDQIITRYKGTRLERQEIFGEVLEDVAGALWTRETLERTRVAEAPAMQRVVVAIDPAGSTEEGSDITGIVVAGLGQDGHAYVLEDCSGRYQPTEWARRAIGAFHLWRADRIVAEINYGGAMVAATVAAVDDGVPIKEITSSRGKVLRAEPIAALFEQSRAHLVGLFEELEDQACRFTSDWQRDRDGSPDRVDAMTFAIAELMLGRPAGRYFRESALLLRGEPVEAPRLFQSVFAVAVASVSESPRLAVVYCAFNAFDYGATPQLVVLDWDLVSVDAALFSDFVPSIFQRLADLVTAVKPVEPQIMGLYIQPIGIGEAVAREWLDHEWPIHDLTIELEPPATLDQRVNLVESHLHSGKEVKISRDAYEKLQTVDGVTRNHLLTQFLAYRPGGDGKDTELLDALILAVASALIDL